MEHFDYFVIGGGSGGIASARRAATYGQKVGVAEYQRLGGTCVNVGCVPKKVMWNVATTKEVLNDSNHFGFRIEGGISFSWEYVKKYRDAYIARLNDIYRRNLQNSNVTFYPNWASFTKEDDKIIVRLSNSNGEDLRVTTEHLLIATGGRPSILGIPGEEWTINSDGFFELETLPKRVAVIGAGYIAVEMAGIFNCLGSDTHLFVRGDMALRKFDELLKKKLMKFMEKHDLRVHPGSIPVAITKDADSGLLSLSLKNGEIIEGFDCILVAVGRVPETWDFPKIDDRLKKENSPYLSVNDYQDTALSKIYALGDVCGKIELTPMAIAAGRRLADRLFGGLTEAKASYELVSTVIFSHPPIGTVGFTEAEAKQHYGEENIKIYKNKSVNLYYGTFDVAPKEKPKTYMKLICLKTENERIIGLHVIGMGADEMIQGFGVAVKMGATKANFDSCVAVHPTAAEEFVTMAPWGL
nr:thioredoxin-disufide reductase [Cardiosporidium cionae]AZL94296.1 thioredoxin-disufide reductase [Cardiosporidium cionae]